MYFAVVGIRCAPLSYSLQFIIGSVFYAFALKISRAKHTAKAKGTAYVYKLSHTHTVVRSSEKRFSCWKWLQHHTQQLHAIYIRNKHDEYVFPLEHLLIFGGDFALALRIYHVIRFSFLFHLSKPTSSLRFNNIGNIMITFTTSCHTSKYMYVCVLCT